MKTSLARVIPAAAILATLVALESSLALALGMIAVGAVAFWRFVLH